MNTYSEPLEEFLQYLNKMKKLRALQLKFSAEEERKVKISDDYFQRIAQAQNLKGYPRELHPAFS